MISIRNAKNAKTGLVELIDYMGNIGVMVEIGCYVGDSSQIFAGYAKKLYCVDPWQNGYDQNDAASYQHPMTVVEKQFDETMSKFSNVIKIKKMSKDASIMFDDESLDFIYIDGLHTFDGVREDIAAWIQKVKKGGFIGGHDYGSKHHPGVKPAVDQTLRIPDKTFPDTSWIIKL